MKENPESLPVDVAASIVHLEIEGLSLAHRVKVHALPERRSIRVEFVDRGGGPPARRAVELTAAAAEIARALAMVRSFAAAGTLPAAGDE